MNNDTIRHIELETHQTKDISDGHVNGSLTVIWRDWDKILEVEPKMVYVSSVNPGEIKGPHLHTKRDSYFVCIRGKVIFVAKDEKGKYLEIESSEKKPVLIQVPKNFISAHINPTNEVSTILTLANPAWTPNDDEMKNVTFDDYDWNKWK
jgi:dTDP-4-dehydrorhamnose 3,5-epimerase|tara:strand:- start:5990 stop:6439 length:450 start_codon:yes stop_codon:yes gene_type:complete